jgi:acyl carrier protein
MIIDDLKDIFLKISPTINVFKFDENSRIVEDLRLDSLSQLMVVMEIEKKYNIKFEKVITFERVKDVIEYLKEQGAKD